MGPTKCYLGFYMIIYSNGSLVNGNVRDYYASFCDNYVVSVKHGCEFLKLLWSKISCVYMLTDEISVKSGTVTALKLK